MITMIAAVLLISGTVPEKPVVIKNNVVTIKQTATQSVEVVGNKIIVRSKL
jgi:hypothetical protein